MTEGASDLDRRVLASRGIAPVRPAPPSAAPQRPPATSAGFVLGVIAGIVIVSVLALIGLAALVWGAVTWLKGLAW